MKLKQEDLAALDKLPDGRWFEHSEEVIAQPVSVLNRLIEAGYLIRKIRSAPAYDVMYKKTTKCLKNRI